MQQSSLIQHEQGHMETMLLQRGPSLSDLPSATGLAEAREIVARWDAALSPIDKLGAELVEVSIANLSRRKPEGWTERDLLTETTLHQHRFDRDLLRGGPLRERYFDAPRGEMEHVLAVAQYIILYRNGALEPDLVEPEIRP